MSKRKHDQSTTAQTGPTLYESTPIHDRSSTFTAIFTPSSISPSLLQHHPPFESASHRILAWRKPSAQRSLAGSFSVSTSSSPAAKPSTQSGEQQRVIHETGSDDDGEKYAGKKLEKVLTDMDVAGTVVVARWYGGVLLGPVRFKWIEDSAREAVLKWKRSQEPALDGGGESKRAKVNEVTKLEDEKEQARLVRVLQERDTSVNILRALLAEKNADLRKLEAGNETGGDDSVGKRDELTKSPSTILPEYSSMPVQRLKQLEKARDATLKWILNQIDLVEEKVNAIKEVKDRS